MALTHTVTSIWLFSLECKNRDLAKAVLINNITLVPLIITHPNNAGPWSISTMMTSSNEKFPRYWPFVRGIHRSRSSDVFFDMHMNTRLSKQSWGWWFETPSWSLWRYCNDEFLVPRGVYAQLGEEFMVWKYEWANWLSSIFRWWKSARTIWSLSFAKMCQ